MPAIMGLLGEMAPIGSRRLLAISEEGGLPLGVGIFSRMFPRYR